MRNKLLLTIIIILAFAGTFVVQWLMTRSFHDEIERTGEISGNGPGDEDGGQEHIPEVNRIISMSPSITEILFELGIGDKVVGVTSFCKYPPEAEAITKIGGYLDPNYEAIVALEPDLVILRVENKKAEKQLGNLKLRTGIVDHNSINGILDSFTFIGKICGVEEEAGRIKDNLRNRMKAIAQKTSGRAGPKVLICVDRNRGTGSIKGVYVAGRDGFYNELIRIAGGISAFEETGIPFPKVSAEGILRADPDVIIELIPNLNELELDENAILDDWKTLPHISAVKSGRLHILAQGFMVIPGPRFIMTIEELAKLLQPELDWE